MDKRLEKLPMAQAMTAKATMCQVDAAPPRAENLRYERRGVTPLAVRPNAPAAPAHGEPGQPAEQGPLATVVVLPRRQQQTLALLLEGKREKEVADELGLSPSTVHEYVRALYRHFGVSSRAELSAHFLDLAQLAGLPAH